ncbi:MAG: LPP20 family lipoprotein [Chitinivibrionia bacterium]|nr:LPP20 family lipoprotein [Chitinivibrionia bacterium]MCL1946356.1 LPP20 family lipoprotein [Chitinivibrionia bacterium]
MKKFSAILLATAIIAAQSVSAASNKQSVNAATKPAPSRQMGDEWVESGQMIRYPVNKYFTAVGMGNDENSARRNATIEIRRQISTTVKSEQISKEFSITSNNASTDSSLFSARNRISVVGDITGVEILATSVRGENYYAFAILEKEKFISFQKTKITELQNELKTINAQADKAISDKKIALAISLLNSAKEKILAIQSERLLLSAATALTAKEEIPVSRADIDGKLANLLNSIKIVASGGDKQTVFAGEISTEPLSAKVTADGQAIENLSISLFDDKNKKTATAFSDENGSVYFFLDSKAPTLRGTYKYTAKVDLEGVKNSASASFSYTVKIRDLPAQISISLSNDLRKGAAAIESAAKEMLSSHGILNDDCGCFKVSVEISDNPKENIEGLSKQRTFVRSSVTAQISISDDKGKQIYSGSVTNLGAANDRLGAVADGVKKIQLGATMTNINEAVKNYEEAQSQKAAAFVQGEKKKIAVFPLIHSGFEGQWYSYSNFEALSAMLTTALVNTNAFIVLERQMLELSQSELKYSETKTNAGETNEDGEQLTEAQEINQAKIMGAEWAVVGTLTRAQNLIEADVRIVDIKTSQIVASVSANGKNVYDFRDIAQKLVAKLNLPEAPNAIGSNCCK